MRAAWRSDCLRNLHVDATIYREHLMRWSCIQFCRGILFLNIVNVPVWWRCYCVWLQDKIKLNMAWHNRKSLCIAHAQTDLCISFWFNEMLRLVLVITCVFVHVVSFLLVCSACFTTGKSVGKLFGEEEHLVARRVYWQREGWIWQWTGLLYRAGRFWREPSDNWLVIIMHDMNDSLESQLLHASLL